MTTPQPSHAHLARTSGSWTGSASAFGNQECCCDRQRLRKPNRLSMSLSSVKPQPQSRKTPRHTHSSATKLAQQSSRRHAETEAAAAAATAAAERINADCSDDADMLAKQREIVRKLWLNDHEAGPPTHQIHPRIELLALSRPPRLLVVLALLAFPSAGGSRSNQLSQRTPRS